MTALYISIFFAVSLAVTYVFLIMPRTVDAADMELQSTDYAMRGIHGVNIPESSRLAFVSARDQGYGILVDLSLTVDKRLVTVRPSLLKRAYRDRAVIGDQILYLPQLLELIDGHVPIMLNISPSANAPAICRLLCEYLDTYSGAFSVISSEPEILGFFKKYRPRYARGIIIFPRSRTVGSAFRRFALSSMLTNFIARPDFIAIDARNVKDPTFLLVTRIFKARAFAYSVNSDKLYDSCRRRGIYAIFNKIRPQ